MSTPITAGPSADDGPTAIHPKANPGLSRPSRRKVLGALGIGAAAVATPGVATALDRRRRSADGGNQAGRRGGGRADNAGQRGGGRGLAEPSPDEVAPDRFTRIFDDLNPFADNSEELREALIEIGRPSGIMDANDPLEVGLIRLITEPELSPDNRDNPNATAGTTSLGQFVDHDLTMGAASQLGRPPHRFDEAATYEPPGSISTASTEAGRPSRQSSTKRPTNCDSGSSPAAASRICPVTTRAAPSSPTPAMTRT